MNVSCRAENPRIKTSIILIVVIASLCFAVGEGLRLTPFPIASLIGVGATETPLSIKSADQFSSHKYGPLDVPTQHQKRNKRQAVPLDFFAHGKLVRDPCCPALFSDARAIRHCLGSRGVPVRRPCSTVRFLINPKTQTAQKPREELTG